MRRAKKKYGLNFWLVLMFLLMIAVFISSQMTYRQQEIRSSWLVPSGPLFDFFNSLHFNYAGQNHSMAIDGQIKFMEFMLRKAAHFCTFGAIAFTGFLGFRDIIPNKVWRFFIVLFATTGYAATDEFHQSLTSGRTPMIQDVMLDATGALFFLVLLVLILWIFRRRK